MSPSGSASPTRKRGRGDEPDDPPTDPDADTGTEDHQPKRVKTTSSTPMAFGGNRVKKNMISFGGIKKKNQIPVPEDEKGTEWIYRWENRAPTPDWLKEKTQKIWGRPLQPPPSSTTPPHVLATYKDADSQPFFPELAVQTEPSILSPRRTQGLESSSQYQYIDTSAADARRRRVQQLQETLARNKAHRQDAGSHSTPVNDTIEVDNEDQAVDADSEEAAEKQESDLQLYGGNTTDSSYLKTHLDASFKEYAREDSIRREMQPCVQKNNDSGPNTSIVEYSLKNVAQDANAAESHYTQDEQDENDPILLIPAQDKKMYDRHHERGDLASNDVVWNFRDSGYATNKNTPKKEPTSLQFSTSTSSETSLPESRMLHETIESLPTPVKETEHPVPHATLARKHDCEEDRITDIAEHSSSQKAQELAPSSNSRDNPSLMSDSIEPASKCMMKELSGALQEETESVTRESFQAGKATHKLGAIEDIDHPKRSDDTDQVDDKSIDRIGQNMQPQGTSPAGVLPSIAMMPPNIPRPLLTPTFTSPAGVTAQSTQFFSVKQAPWSRLIGNGITRASQGSSDTPTSIDPGIQAINEPTKSQTCIVPDNDTKNKEQVSKSPQRPTYVTKSFYGLKRKHLDDGAGPEQKRRKLREDDEQILGKNLSEDISAWSDTTYSSYGGSETGDEDTQSSADGANDDENCSTEETTKSKMMSLQKKTQDPQEDVVAVLSQGVGKLAASPGSGCTNHELNKIVEESKTAESKSFQDERGDGSDELEIIIEPPPGSSEDLDRLVFATHVLRQNQKTPCKNINNPRGCQFGANCRFSHLHKGYLCPVDARKEVCYNKDCEFAHSVIADNMRKSRLPRCRWISQTGFCYREQNDCPYDHAESLVTAKPRTNGSSYNGPVATPWALYENTEAFSSLRDESESTQEQSPPPISVLAEEPSNALVPNKVQPPVDSTASNRKRSRNDFGEKDDPEGPAHKKTQLRPPMGNKRTRKDDSEDEGPEPKRHRNQQVAIPPVGRVSPQDVLPPTTKVSQPPGELRQNRSLAAGGTQSLFPKPIPTGPRSSAPQRRSNPVPVPTGPRNHIPAPPARQAARSAGTTSQRPVSTRPRSTTSTQQSGGGIGIASQQTSASDLRNFSPQSQHKSTESDRGLKRNRDEGQEERRVRRRYESETSLLSNPREEEAGMRIRGIAAPPQAAEQGGEQQGGEAAVIFTLSSSLSAVVADSEVAVDARGAEAANGSVVNETGTGGHRQGQDSVVYRCLCGLQREADWSESRLH
ncbi:hypothetical protein K491DRAFT_714181 [Lophiostoma macrostomum CBS 122681]|uniref:C3H1-type domain-containing protein n=1 Tax=Lophiostoma macrostomum CBS 122681 TaxID=1314788 RepID=A0A6A6TE58_9PLEO|nr:hypothetical protein K491DRAFT_714181 [Lophiostoma macrostomum CBS 122681]